MRLPRPLRRPRRPAISAEPWPSSHRRHRAARDHWTHAPVCLSVSAPFLRPRLLSPTPHCAHRTPSASPSRVAAATGPWLARIVPYASIFRRMREKGPFPGNICAKCMLLEIKMARSSPYASISRRNRAIRDAWRANLAIKAPFSRRGPGNHAWREDVASAARPFAAPRCGSRARELAEWALCPAARAWSTCRMRGSLLSRPSRRHSRPGPAARAARAPSRFLQFP